MTSKKSVGYCFVPGCNNTRRTVPEKLFFHVPLGEMRRKWCEVARRDPSSITSTSRHKYCCEDHFTLEDDMQDWIRYKIMKDAGMKTYKLKLKPHVVPHIFDCQPDRRSTHSKRVRTAFAKRQRAEIIENLLKEIKEAEPTFYFKREPEQTEPPIDRPEYFEEEEESSDFAEEPLVHFDYQDSLWAPYCDIALQEDSSTETTDLQTNEICAVSHELTEGSTSSLTDGTCVVSQADPSASPTDLQTTEANTVLKLDENNKTIEVKSLKAQTKKTHIKRTNLKTSKTEANNVSSNSEAGSNFWNWKVLECDETDETGVS